MVGPREGECCGRVNGGGERGALEVSKFCKEIVTVRDEGAGDIVSERV